MPDGRRGLTAPAGERWRSCSSAPPLRRARSRRARPCRRRSRGRTTSDARRARRPTTTTRWSRTPTPIARDAAWPAGSPPTPLVEVGRHVAPGVTTDELDRIGHEFLVAHGAYPSTLGYKDYPKSLCTSVNEVICHGIPDSRAAGRRRRRQGRHHRVRRRRARRHLRDVLRRRRSRRRCASSASAPARRCCAASARSGPGRPISVIGRVIESYAKRFGYGVVRDYTGHGVGPSLPHPADDPALRRARARRPLIEPGHDVHRSSRC